MESVKLFMPLIKTKTGIEPDLILLNKENIIKIESYARFLQLNLEAIFSKIVRQSDVAGLIDEIDNISLSFENSSIRFSITLYPVYKGKWTTLCPELFSCVSQANSKIDALNNICFSISESIFLNKSLDTKILNEKITVPMDKFSVNEDLYGPDDVCGFLCSNYNFDQIFIASKNIILRKKSIPNINVTIPYFPLNSFTFEVIEKILVQKIRDTLH